LAQKNPSKEEWLQLFNGKDFTGWDIKIAGHNLNDNYKNTFRVENGVMKVSYDQYNTFDDKFGHIYYQQPFSYYIIRVEYRFTGNQLAGGAAWNVRNSGVMIHSQSAKSMPKAQDFPISLEVQLLGGLGSGERHTGNLCTPGTLVEMNGKINPAHCIDSHSGTYHGDQWVTVEAIVLGDSLVHHVVEGDTVLTYEKPQIGGGFVSNDYDWERGHVTNYQEWVKKDGTLLKEGYIALQAESHPIEFRKVELLNLKGCMNPKCSNYKSYYLAQGDCTCKNTR
jgi:hypothetical protein